MKLKLNQFIAAAWLIPAGLNLNAQEAGKETPLYQLPEYTVSASRMEMPLGKVGSSISVLDKSEIERFEANLSSDLLRTVPGIYMRNNGGSGTSSGVTMRGLPVAPLALIDGIEINSPDSGSLYNFGNLPTTVIDSIEVLRGAQSALYGGNALTGVISINTRKPGKDYNEFLAGTSYGTHQTTSSYLSASADLDKVDFTIIGSYYDTDGFSAQPTGFGEEWADDDGHTIKMIHGRMAFELTDRVNLSIVAHYRDSEAEYDPGSPSPYSTPIFNNYMTEEQFLAKAKIDITVSDIWDLSASGNYNHLEDFNHNAYGASEGEAEMKKIDLINNFQFTDQYQAIVGLEHETAADKIGNYEFDTQSIFTENVFEATDELTLSIGGRYDDNDAFGDEATWRTSFSYLINPTGLRLKGSYGTGFDAPEISQLFGAYGDPDLKAEEGSSYDLGIEWRSEDGRFNVGLTYFDIEVEDKIEYLRSTNAYANVNWVSEGVEAFAEYYLTSDTRFSLSYSYADADRERTADDLILHSPEAVWTASIDQDFLQDRLKLRLTCQRVGERETWDGPSDAFFTVDVAASYQATDNLQIWARVDNLFDEDYQEILNYNGAPFALNAGVRYSF